MPTLPNILENMTLNAKPGHFTKAFISFRNKQYDLLILVVVLYFKSIFVEVYKVTFYANRIQTDHPFARIRSEQ